MLAFWAHETILFTNAAACTLVEGDISEGAEVIDAMLESQDNTELLPGFSWLVRSSKLPTSRLRMF